MNRSVKSIHQAQSVNMGGIILDQALPLQKVESVDPFLLIHHWKDELRGGKKQADSGVGPHPHRGFSPVTFIFEGSVHHRDSEGYENEIHKGGTQWMNSGSGLVHSERPGKKLIEQGGTFEIIQFWVNAPAKDKMSKPSYYGLSQEDTPTVEFDNGQVIVSVAAGSFEGASSPIEPYSDLIALRILAKKNGKATLPINEGYNALVYILNGGLKINDRKVAGAKDIVVFNNDGSTIDLEILEDTRFILLAGEPIDEPVATYGPFVMNTQAEIVTALNDFQAGKMGELKEVFI